METEESNSPESQLEFEKTELLKRLEESPEACAILFYDAVAKRVRQVIDQFGAPKTGGYYSCIDCGRGLKELYPPNSDKITVPQGVVADKIDCDTCASRPGVSLVQQIKRAFSAEEQGWFNSEKKWVKITKDGLEVEK